MQAKMLTPVGLTNQYVNKIFTKHKTFEISLLKKSDLAVSKLRLFIDKSKRSILTIGILGVKFTPFFNFAVYEIRNAFQLNDVIVVFGPPISLRILSSHCS